MSSRFLYWESWCLQHFAHAANWCGQLGFAGIELARVGMAQQRSPKGDFACLITAAIYIALVRVNPVQQCLTVVVGQRSICMCGWATSSAGTHNSQRSRRGMCSRPSADLSCCSQALALARANLPWNVKTTEPEVKARHRATGTDTEFGAPNEVITMGSNIDQMSSGTGSDSLEHGRHIVEL